MIRKVTIEDAEDIARIYNHYVSATTISFETELVTQQVMAERIAETSANYPYFVYETDGNVMGYCYAHQWKERAAYVHTLETTVYLAQESIGKDVGTELMKRLIDACRAAGYKSLVACITAENVASCAFHERLGFKKVSHFKAVGRKFGRWLDVVDYELLLKND